MKSLEFFFACGVVPFLIVAVYPRLIRFAGWRWVVLATVAVIAIDFGLLRSEHDLIGATWRALVLGATAVGLGWIYERYFWDKDRKYLQ